MASPKAFVSGKEQFFPDEDIIVSKTDLKGRITYVNREFLKIAGYEEHEVMGQPHSMIRHPDMPRTVFKLLWETIQSNDDVYAYVVNRCKNGDHYWVLAHVTPSHDSSGNVIAYHSNRWVPDRRILTEVVMPLYADLRREEQKHTDRKTGLSAASDYLQSLLRKKGSSYDEFVFSL